MSGNRLRCLGFGLLASAGASLLGLTSMMHAPFAYGDDTAFVIGGSGTPIPDQSFVDTVEQLFLTPNGYGDYAPQALATPEGNSPLYTPVQSLTLDESEAQGVKILNNAILAQTENGNNVVVYGDSQSSTISSMEMANLLTLPQSEQPGLDQLAFVLTGDPNNPAGGLFERFDGLSIPSLGITFNGATPDVYPTDIFIQEYDGFADFPQYPIDPFSDLNALLGVYFVHGTYSDLTLQQVTPVADGGDAIPLPTDPAFGTETSYYLIPTTDLPLLDPVRDIPIVGNPLADLLQPDLTVLVNIGYGNPDYGYSAGPDGYLPANEPTPFGLFPDINLSTVAQDLLNGAQTGWQAFESDISSEISEFETGGLSALLGSSSDTGTSSVSLSELLTALSSDLSSPEAFGTTITDIVNALSGAAATAYSTLVPAADVANALLTTLPNYDLTLFLSGLGAGNVVDAIGYPIAADEALVPLAGLIDFAAIANAAQTVASDLSGLF
ncbi:MAG TPA: PE-PPE domain-containing protein [Mycobacterium sp.]|nr:PE-PPE domain-containing protein [Mycobacterium sp.]